jgi:nucleoside-diphosphate-sugar epimerase
VRILVTGAASPLGVAVASTLARAGHAVRGTDGAAQPAPAAGVLAAGYHGGDLADPDFVPPLLEGVQCVVHLAPLALAKVAPAGAPGEVLDAAARGTHVLVKAAVEAGIAWIVQGSTLAVMDAYDDDLEVTEQWRPRPSPTPEHLAPYLSELVTREFTRDVHLAAPPHAICLRFGNLVADTPAAAAGPRVLPVVDAAQAVALAVSALQRGAQRGHRWQLYHVAALTPEARYTSRAARQALGYGQPAEGDIAGRVDDGGGSGITATGAGREGPRR